MNNEICASVVVMYNELAKKKNYETRCPETVGMRSNAGELGGELKDSN